MFKAVTFVVDGDMDALDIIDTFALYLKEIGLSVTCDGKEHDGYEIVTIKPLLEDAQHG